MKNYFFGQKIIFGEKQKYIYFFKMAGIPAAGSKGVKQKNKHKLESPSFFVQTIISSHFTFNPLHSRGRFSCQLNRSVRYVHSFLWVPTTLVDSQWFLKLAANAWFGRRFKNQWLRVNLLGVVGVNGQWCSATLLTTVNLEAPTFLRCLYADIWSFF